MRRSKKKSGGHRSFTLPIALVAGAVSPLLAKPPSGRTSLAHDLMTGQGSAFVYDAREVLVGVDNTGKFRPEWLVKTYLPLAVGLGVHVLAGKVGFNRALGRARVPVLRV